MFVPVHHNIGQTKMDVSNKLSIIKFDFKQIQLLVELLHVT